MSADARSAKLLAHHVVLPLELARSLVEDQKGVEVKAPEAGMTMTIAINITILSVIMSMIQYDLMSSC